MWLFDRLTNLVSGLGTAKDKAANNGFVLPVLSPAELHAMHRSDWLARKIVDIIPHDMTREWRVWQAEDPEIEKIEEAERALGLQQKVTEAMQRARLLGGAGLYIGTGQGDVEGELTPEAVGAGGIAYLHVLSREEITAGEVVRDVLSPYFGRPAYYQLTAGTGTTVRIHPSRVIPFVGAPIFDRHATTADPWGDSVLQVVYDAVQNAASSQQHVASLIPEAKLDVIRVPNLSDYLATDQGTKQLTQRFTLANQLKSSINALLLEGDGETGETWEQKQINFAAFPELMRLFLQVAAGAADIPVTRLLGQSPSGLNATGDGDIRNYYDNVASRQEVELRPTLAPLDEMLIRHALGSRPAEVHYAWSPLWQLDEVQKADIAAKKAATTKVYCDTGLIPLDALAKVTVNQLVEDGTYPGLEAAIDESPEEPGDGAATAEERAAEEMAAAVRQPRTTADGGGPNADRPFADAFNPLQPRGPNGRWIDAGARLLAALGLAGQNTVVHVPFGDVRRAGEVRKLTGVDVRGFKHAASNQSMRHALAQHGNAATERARGQKAITPADFSRLPDIVRGGTYHVADQRPFGPLRIEIRATVGGDRYTYVGEIRRKKRRIDMVTVWKK